MWNAKNLKKQKIDGCQGRDKERKMGEGCQRVRYRLPVMSKVRHGDYC